MSDKKPRDVTEEAIVRDYPRMTLDDGFEANEVGARPEELLARREAAQALLEQLKRAAPQAEAARAISDREALAEGLPRKGVLFLLGDLEQNQVLRELADEVPFVIEESQVRVGARCIAGLREPAFMGYWSSDDGERLTVVWTAPTSELPRADHPWILLDGGVRVLEGFFAPKNRLTAVVR